MPLVERAATRRGRFQVRSLAATVGAGEDLQVAMAALEAASAMLVLDDGKPVGLITRSDLLGYLSHV